MAALPMVVGVMGAGATAVGAGVVPVSGLPRVLLLAPRSLLPITITAMATLTRSMTTAMVTHRITATVIAIMSMRQPTATIMPRRTAMALQQPRTGAAIGGIIIGATGVTAMV
ncbi:MAG: hypothetical protein BGN91_14365 [Nitrobacter sp. 62-13]|nr:MAG: hypothetical protein BGN91_14365 [Nitrobacter sp. 62-13]